MVFVVLDRISMKLMWCVIVYDIQVIKEDLSNIIKIHAVIRVTSNPCGSNFQSLVCHFLFLYI